MITVPLSAIPNQSLSIQLDLTNYDIEILACGNVMAATISIDNVQVVSGVRLVPNGAIIASAYMQVGNFVLVTDDDEYPDYNFFGIDQFLIYASPIELAQIAAGTFVIPI
jgi:hypothetical protein